MADFFQKAASPGVITTVIGAADVLGWGLGGGPGDRRCVSRLTCSAATSQVPRLPPGAGTQRSARTRPWGSGQPPCTLQAGQRP